MELLENEIPYLEKNEQCCSNPQPTNRILAVVLLGPRNSGKTTLGKYVAKLLDFNFLDFDSIVQIPANLNRSDTISLIREKELIFLNILKNTETKRVNSVILSNLYDNIQSRFSTAYFENTNKSVVISLGGGIVDELAAYKSILSLSEHRNIYTVTLLPSYIELREAWTNCTKTPKIVTTLNQFNSQYTRRNYLYINNGADTIYLLDPIHEKLVTDISETLNINITNDSEYLNFNLSLRLTVLKEKILNYIEQHNEIQENENEVSLTSYDEISTKRLAHFAYQSKVAKHNLVTIVLHASQPLHELFNEIMKPYIYSIELRIDEASEMQVHSAIALLQIIEALKGKNSFFPLITYRLQKESLLVPRSFALLQKVSSNTEDSEEDKIYSLKGLFIEKDHRVKNVEYFSLQCLKSNEFVIGTGTAAMTYSSLLKRPSDIFLIKYLISPCKSEHMRFLKNQTQLDTLHGLIGKINFSIDVEINMDIRRTPNSPIPDQINNGNIIHFKYCNKDWISQPLIKSSTLILIEKEILLPSLGIIGCGKDRLLFIDYFENTRIPKTIAIYENNILIGYFIINNHKQIILEPVKVVSTHIFQSDLNNVNSTMLWALEQVFFDVPEVVGSNLLDHLKIRLLLIHWMKILKPCAEKKVAISGLDRAFSNESFEINSQVKLLLTELLFSYIKKFIDQKDFTIILLGKLGEAYRERAGKLILALTDESKLSIPSIPKISMLSSLQGIYIQKAITYLN